MAIANLKMSNRSNLRKSINKIGGKNAIKLAIGTSENGPQAESDDWKINWMNQYAQSQQVAYEKIRRLELVISRQANQIAKQKEKAARRNVLLMKMSKLLTKKNRRLEKYKARCIDYQEKSDKMRQNRVDVGVNTEYGPATMNEMRSRMILSTTDLFDKSSTSTNSVNPFVATGIVQSTFGGGSVFYNKMSSTDHSSTFSRTFGELSNALEHIVQSSEPDQENLISNGAQTSNESAHGVQQVDTQCNAEAMDHQSDVHNNELGMLSNFFLFKSIK